jgi:hypothetical protein
MNVVFHNAFHRGDIHNSRGVISHIIKTLGKNNYFYHHSNGPKLLADLNINYSNQSISLNQNVLQNNDTIYINTHIGCKDENKNPFCGFGCNALGNMHLLNYIYRQLNVNALETNEWNLVPEINYNYFINNKIKTFLDTKTNKTILFCNGPVLSGQCPNFSFSNIIINLAKKYQNYNFIVTQPEIELQSIDNIIFSKDIIGDVGGSDLNEIACLSTKCDIIIGRASGPFMFAQTKTTLEDPHKTFIAFNSTIKDAFFSTIGKSQKVWSEVYTYDNIFDIIDSKIK